MIFPHFWWWVQHWTGAYNPSSVAYGWWSGFGSDLTEFVIIIGFVQLIRKHNCHVKSCWRVGKFHLDGTPYTVCRIHHPDITELNESRIHSEYEHAKKGRKK